MLNSTQCARVRGRTALTTEGNERAKTILQTEFDKPSEVSNAHMQCFIGLPIVHGTQPAEIRYFYGKLSSHIQALETMGKVKEIGGFVRLTLDKLSGVRADLVRLDDNWQEWGFRELIESLRKWCDINPVHSVLLTAVPNLKYDELISKYRHLPGGNMDDTDEKSELPIYVILGASEYSRFKTETKPRIGQSSEPVAELTTLGWTIISSGIQRKLPSRMFI